MIQREVFNAKNELNDFIFSVKSIINMQKDEQESFIQLFNKYGAVVLESETIEDHHQSLMSLSKHFGNVIGHDRADKDGITEISNLEGNDGYLGASYVEHPLHTGGVYSDEPPIIILLQCVKQSETGGDTILVSSKNIYDFLKKTNIEWLESLKNKNSVTIRRGNSEASRAIFDKNYLKNGSYMFSFRCDNVIEFDLKPSNLILPLAEIKKFIDNPDNQIRFRLKENQILVADNAAVMHARTAFPEKSDRRLLRLTLDGKNDKLVLGFDD